MRRLRLLSRSASCAIKLVLFLTAHRVVAQEAVIRGVVSSASGRVIPNATIIVTMAPLLEVRRTATDSVGSYRVTFENPSGDYVVYAVAPGFRAARRRVTGNQVIIAVDLSLAPDVTELPVVRSVIRPRPLPEFGQLHDPTTAAEYPNGLASAIGAERAGDLSAVASTVPGISLTPDGRPVAFGLVGQMSTTFNGLSLATTQLPPDLRAYVTVTTSPYDATVGGFGAGRINVEMAQGGRVYTTFGRVTAAGPTAGSANSVGSPVRGSPMRVNLSGSADGPIGPHDTWFNGGAQYSRRWTQDATDANASAMERFGLSPDSLARLDAIAARLSIPGWSTAVRSGYLNEQFRGVLRVDHYADPATYRKLWKNAFSITAIGNFDKTDLPGNGVTAKPSYGGSHSQSVGQLFASWIHLGTNVTSELYASAADTRRASRPYVTAPTAAVDIASSQTDTSAGIQRTILLGGWPLRDDIHVIASELVEMLHFQLGDSHDIKLYGRSSLESASGQSMSNENGLFTFRSLADFDASRPATFQRSVGGDRRSSSVWRGSAAVTDLWRPTRSVQFFPGIRFDGVRALRIPDNDRALAGLGLQALGRPSFVSVSPRLGFSWTYAPSRELTTGSGSIGRIYLPPLGSLSGGFGAFRNELGATSLLDVRSGGGNAQVPRRLACYGPAVPSPDWAAYDDGARAPDQCADGAPAQFVDAGPSLVVFSPAYRSPVSWRGNLQWGGVTKSIRYAFNAVIAENRNQIGVRDLNFAGVPAFALSSEANRPVFVPVSSIDARNGAVSPAAGRRDPTLGQAREVVSDLRSTARQITVTLEPVFRRSVLRADYTLGTLRADGRGFDGTTFASPTLIESARSSYDVRHRITIGAGRELWRGLGGTVLWSFQSGMPFTPLVGSDINGDRLANDRAFVFGPGRGDPAVDQAITRLIRTAPPTARRCLEQQRGRVAEANSCEGPWTAMMDASVRTSRIHLLDDREATISIDFSNVLAGFDELFHGAGGLHGWGTTALPDAVLYQVRAFDPQARAFSYAVNPRFGATNPRETGLWNPFRLTVSVQLELGRPRRHSNFDRFLAVDATKQDLRVASIDTLASRLGDEITDGYVMLLRQRDSLLLTASQVRALDSMHAAYRGRAQALWREAASYILEQRANPDFRGIDRRLDEDADTNWALQRAEVPRMLAVLSPAQGDLARSMLRFVIESDKIRPARFRNF